MNLRTGPLFWIMSTMNGQGQGQEAISQSLRACSPLGMSGAFDDTVPVAPEGLPLQILQHAI